MSPRHYLYLICGGLAIIFVAGNSLKPTGTAIPLNEDEVHCLAQTIYHESRGESLAGQLAVGMVVVNRTKSDVWPKTICETVKQGPISSNGIPIKNRCQFSWYCANSKMSIKEEELWQRSLSVSRSIIGGEVFDFTDGATFFHSNKVNPKWNYKKVAQIDNHIFYRK